MGQRSPTISEAQKRARAAADPIFPTRGHALDFGRVSSPVTSEAPSAPTQKSDEGFAERVQGIVRKYELPPEAGRLLQLVHKGDGRPIRLTAHEIGDAIGIPEQHAAYLRNALLRADILAEKAEGVMGSTGLVLRRTA
jgi:guanyl-specific ribonuclease Sa